MMNIFRPDLYIHFYPFVNTLLRNDACALALKNEMDIRALS